MVIEDGLKFLSKAATSGKTYKAILFDVDSKDTSLGMSCPPKVFLEQSVMDDVKKCIGEKGRLLIRYFVTKLDNEHCTLVGIFILNLVCRDEKLREQVLIDLRHSFRSICSYKLDEDVNEVLYCRNDTSFENLPAWKSNFELAAKNLNSVTKEHKIASDEIIDVTEFLKDLKL